MDAGGLAWGRFLSPPSLGKGRRLAGSQEGNPSACLGWIQGDTTVLPVRYDRGLDRRAGDGKVDSTSPQQPPRLREHRLSWYPRNATVDAADFKAAAMTLVRAALELARTEIVAIAVAERIGTTIGSCTVVVDMA